VRRTNTRARGSLYVAVLCIGMLVAVMGISSLVVVRLEGREVEDIRDTEEAEHLSQAALELGRLAIRTDSSWRTSYTSGTWGGARSFGRGTLAWRVVDEVDHNLANNVTDPVRLYGRGTVGGSVRVTSVVLVLTKIPLPALGMAIHTQGQLHLRTGQSLKVSDAIASTNTQLRNDGTITGNVEALTSSGTGTVTGTTTLGVSPKVFPDGSVITLYANRGTVINPGSSIDKRVLSPASNPWGVPNPDGVYVINTTADTTIQNSRIVGTLVINCPGKKVTIQNTVLMQAGRPDYPVLIVNGNAVFNYNSSGVFLSETSLATNFNPPGTPYLGADDSDQLDQYPSEIQGLVHVTGTLTCTNTPLVRGLVLVESSASTDAVDLSGTVEIVYDSKLYTDPPEGYYTPEMSPQGGTRRREAQ
jgi:hypothetical protein